MNSKAIQILVNNGNPNGLKIIEIAGWVGKCFVVPRQNIKDLKERPESNQPGIYFLFGIDTETNKEIVYIGESESFYSRISSHDSNKYFWNTAVVFCGGLNRAFVKYLEYKATTLAIEAGRMHIENKVQPQENTLSEFEKVSIGQYFENIKFILSVFHYELFESLEESFIDNTFYFIESDGVNAKAKILENGEVLVMSGSVARIRETESFSGWSKIARQQFLKEGKFIIKDDNSYELSEDVIFKSPSAAAATLVGRSINGWTAWKDKDGNTLDENLRK